MKPAIELPDDGRILLIRTSAIGDVVHCLPVLTALRRHRPDATIGWVVEAALAPLLQGHPDLDQILPVRLRRWRRAPWAADNRRELFAALRSLRSFRADAVVDLMGNHKAAALARLSGCRRRIGARRADRREPSSSFWINHPVTVRGTHAVDRALSLLDALGLPAEPADFAGDRLFLGTEDPFTDGSLPARFALIHPSAGWENKVYPADQWGRVAGELGEEGLPTLVAVGPGEEALAQRIVETSGGAATAVDAIGLAKLGHLTRRAALVLGGDSGPVHLAHALDRPVLCLMGPTDPRRNGPYELPEQAYWIELPCSFCHKRFDGPRPCLRNLLPGEIVQRALGLAA